MMMTAPRCLAPMTYYEKGHPDADVFPVCWRPAGHTGMHRSRASRAKAARQEIAYKRRRRALLQKARELAA